MLSNLRLTVSEDWLALSVQESPNLFAFRVLSLNFLALLVSYVTANTGFSPFYHDSLTTTTDRQDDKPYSSE